MQTHNSQRSMRIIVSALLAGGLALAAWGCQDSATPAGGTASTMPSATAAPAKGGAQLWSENCMRCHNLRPPTQYSNNEWAVIVHHMRIRADLTGEEADRILAFIKSANTN